MKLFKQGLKRSLFAIATLSLVYSGLELARYIHYYILTTGSFSGPTPFWGFQYDLRIEFVWVLIGPIVYLASSIYGQLWKK